MKATHCDCGAALTTREARVGTICDACYAIHRPSPEVAAADIRRALAARTGGEVDRG